MVLYSWVAWEWEGHRTECLCWFLGQAVLGPFFAQQPATLQCELCNCWHFESHSTKALNISAMAHCANSMGTFCWHLLCWVLRAAIDSFTPTFTMGMAGWSSMTMPVKLTSWQLGVFSPACPGTQHKRDLLHLFFFGVVNTNRAVVSGLSRTVFIEFCTEIHGRSIL